MLAAGLSLGSRRVERPSDGGAVLTATLDGGARAWVDGGGLVTAEGARWSLDWWIGGDDRWYLPASEPSVRQRRLGSGPVVETIVRIPSGDARQTVYGALVDGRPATVIEIENDSPVPVALAVAIRPYTIGPEHDTERGARVAGRRRRPPERTRSSDGSGLRWVNLEDATLRFDDGLLVALPRPPAQFGGSVAHDVLDDVLAGRDLAWEPLGSSGQVDHPVANGAVLYPLPHRTSLRFLLTDGDQPPPSPAAAPDAATVAAGWTSVVDAEAVFAFPDPGLTAAVGAARARLVLEAPDLPNSAAELDPAAGAQLAALATSGHRGDLERVLTTFATSFPRKLGPGDDGAGAAAIVEALAAAAELAGVVPEAALLESVVQTVQVIERSAGRRPWRRTPSQHPKPSVAVAKRGLARLVHLAGDDEGAGRLLTEVGDPAGGVAGARPAATPVPADPALVEELRARGSPAGAWGDDDPDAAARFIVAARALLVDDHGGELVLLPGFAPSWRGGNTEVHRLPTRHGMVSFAVRWHGPRPALLWDVDAGGRALGNGFRLRCPALDPYWSATELRGETLLAGAAEQLPEAPMPGDSFT